MQAICLVDGASTERKIFMNKNFKKLAACVMAASGADVTVKGFALT